MKSPIASFFNVKEKEKWKTRKPLSKESNETKGRTRNLAIPPFLFIVLARKSKQRKNERGTLLQLKEVLLEAKYWKERNSKESSQLFSLSSCRFECKEKKQRILLQFCFLFPFCTSIFSIKHKKERKTQEASLFYIFHYLATKTRKSKESVYSTFSFRALKTKEKQGIQLFHPFFFFEVC